MNRPNNSGFTLIELMIVVAIIGILAAIALPAFQRYVARAQAVEAVNLLGGAKRNIDDYIADTGEFPPDLSTLNLLGVKQSGKYVDSVAVLASASSSGTLVATLRSDRIANPIAGKTVIFSRSLSGSWACSTGGASPIATSLLPKACE